MAAGRGAPWDPPVADVGLVQDEAEAARTPAYDLFPHLKKQPARWRVQLHNERTYGGAVLGPRAGGALVLGYNVLHFNDAIKSALAAQPPKTHLIVLHQMSLDSLAFLGDEFAIELRAVPGKASNHAWVPRERAAAQSRPLQEPLLNWPDPVDELPLEARAVRWLDFEPGSAWRVVLEARRGNQRLPVLVRTAADLHAQRVVVCTLLLEPRNPSHAALLANMLTYATFGWPEVAVLERDAPASFEVSRIVDRLRAQGAPTIAIAAREPISFERWPLAGVQRVVVSANVSTDAIRDADGGAQWLVAGGSIVRVAGNEVSVHTGTSDALWVARRWAVWFNGVAPESWLSSIFATRAVLETLEVMGGRFAQREEAERLGLEAPSRFERKVAALLSRRMRHGNVDHTIGATAAACDLHRLTGGRALTEWSASRAAQWLRDEFDRASLEDQLDIARCLRDAERLERSIAEALPGDVSAVTVTRLRQAALALDEADAGMPPNLGRLERQLDGPHIRSELETKPLLAAEFLTAVFQCRTRGLPAVLGSMSVDTRDAAVAGLISLGGLVQGDLVELNANAASVEARALVAWLDAEEGPAFQMRPELHQTPVTAVEGVLTEVRRAREEEERARTDAPALGSAVHVLGAMALVGAGVVLAAVLRIFHVAIGTDAARLTAAVVVATAVVLGVLRWSLPKKIERVERRDLRLAQGMFGVLVIMLTLALATALVRTVDNVFAAVAVFALAAGAVAAGAVLLLERWQLAPPWLADVLSWVGDPKGLLESMRHRLGRHDTSS
jgi:hypothetical protein